MKIDDSTQSFFSSIFSFSLSLPRLRRTRRSLDELDMSLLTFEIVSLLVLAVSVPYILWQKRRNADGF